LPWAGKKFATTPRFFGKKHCCTTHSGFYTAYHAGYLVELEAAIRKCAKTCQNPDECVVFTGHSQGGAIAAVAGLAMADLNPYVITFGQPATIDAPCDMISSERWYRFVNTKSSDDIGIAYDPVPFVPGLGADFFGHMIILGEDPTGVAYIGLDANNAFGPLNTFGEAHSMIAAHGVPFPGYADRLKALLENTSDFPIQADGFSNHAQCTDSSECLSKNCGQATKHSFKRCIATECDEDSDCPSDRCDFGSCFTKLSSCMPCDEDSDCAGGNCLLSKCSGHSGLMDDNCICKWDTDCDSGRCELFATGTCEAQLAVGAHCNEDSDCHTDYCTWRFQCDEKGLGGDYCTATSQCLSGSCNWRFRCTDHDDKAVSSAESMAIRAPAGKQQSPGATIYFGVMLSLACACVVVVKYAGPAYRRYRDGYHEVFATELSV
jgi:hypothetical protein